MRQILVNLKIACFPLFFPLVNPTFILAGLDIGPYW
jgi:hypothetical protein